MDLNIWCVLASVLVIATHARRFDQGPQQFYESSTSPPQDVQNYETKDILLYLTPNQVKVLQAGGAVVRPNEHDPEYPVETAPEQEEEPEEDEDLVQEERENTGEEKPKQISELREIFRILNEQIAEDAKKSQSPYVPQVNEEQEEGEVDGGEEDEEERPQRVEEEQESDEEEKEIEHFRDIAGRFGVLQKPRTEQYFAPSVIKKQNQQVKQAYLRHLSDNRKAALLHQEANKNAEKKREDKNQESKSTIQGKYKIIPVEEAQEHTQKENWQKTEADLAQEKLTELLAPILSNDKVVQSIAQHRGQLVQNELQLQTTLHELKEAPRHNNQKYAIEIERLRANLEKQNALARAEVLAKTTPFKSKEEINGKKFQVGKNRQEFNNFAPFKVRAPQSYASSEGARPIPVPVIKRSRIEVKDHVPVEIEKQGPATVPKKVYVSVNNPYVLERLIPVESNNSPSRKPEELTIIRHVWEH